jgi:hypothetical protein
MAVGGLGSCGLRYKPAVGCFEHGEEPSGSMKYLEFLTAELQIPTTVPSSWLVRTYFKFFKF